MQVFGYAVHIGKKCTFIQSRDETAVGISSLPYKLTLTYKAAVRLPPPQQLGFHDLQHLRWLRVDGTYTNTVNSTVEPRQTEINNETQDLLAEWNGKNSIQETTIYSHSWKRLTPQNVWPYFCIVTKRNAVSLLWKATVKQRTEDIHCNYVLHGRYRSVGQSPKDVWITSFTQTRLLSAGCVSQCTVYPQHITFDVLGPLFGAHVTAFKISTWPNCSTVSR